MLVLTFIICALPLSLSAAETGDGSKMADWTAKIGSISKLDGGVFQINAYSGSSPSLTNKNHARLAVYNGEYKSAKISVTFDADGIFAKRSPQASNPGAGSNDTGIVFGGSGIKAYGEGKTDFTVNNIEDTNSFYFLYFSNDSLILARNDKDRMVDNDGDGVAETKKTFASIASANLSSALGGAWTGIKASGKIKLEVEYTEEGAIEVWVGGNSISALSKPAGTCVPYGGEIGVRCGMGFHVATKIYEAKVAEVIPPLPAPEEWMAKVGTISGLDPETDAFQIDSGSGPRQTMWKKYLKSGKISVTFDVASILGKRAPTASNPGAGTNDTAIIFGGVDVLNSIGATVNNIENISQYYCLMFQEARLSVCLVDKNGVDATGNPKVWQGAIKNPETDKSLSVDLKTVLGEDAWNAIVAADEITASVEFTEAGAINVWVNDTKIDALCSGDGTAVPFGADVGVRAGMGYHVPTKILDWEITGEISDTDPYYVAPDLPGTSGPSSPSNPSNPSNPSTPSTPSTPEEPKDEKDSGATMWIIIAVVAAVVVAGAVVGVVVAKKKKA